jgi:hypothetical protein
MPNDLENRFWDIALKDAQSAGFQIAPGCEQYLRGMILEGVRRITIEGAREDPARIAIAEDNLRKFVARMVDEAKHLKLDMLHENTFLHAKSILCPLWPFC